MLLNIHLNNISSIESADINFTKDSYKFRSDNILDEVVNPLSIYGHNGSGKTAVVKALGQLIDMMILPPNAITPFIVNDFQLKKAIRNARANSKKVIEESVGTIILTFKMDSSIFVYELSTTTAGFVTREKLIKDNKNVYVYNYDSGLRFRSEAIDKSVPISVVPQLRRLASLRVQDSDVQVAYSYLSNFTFVDLPNKNNSYFVHSRVYEFSTAHDLLVKYSEQVKELLAKYDDYPKYLIKKDTSNAALNNRRNPYYLVIEDGEFKEELDIGFMSKGMYNNSLLLSLLLSAPDNGVIFIDEIEQALHPSTVRTFLDIVKSKKIQLLFTSHNTNILQSLRPDQIYFAKWRKGHSKYFRLSNIYPNIREVNNIEKMYLSNIFEEYMNGE